MNIMNIWVTGVKKKPKKKNLQNFPGQTSEPIEAIIPLITIFKATIIINISIISSF